jgi:hypothetical protein
MRIAMQMHTFPKLSIATQEVSKSVFLVSKSEGAHRDICFDQRIRSCLLPQKMCVLCNKIISLNNDDVDLYI